MSFWLILEFQLKFSKYILINSFLLRSYFFPVFLSLFLITLLNFRLIFESSYLILILISFYLFFIKFSSVLMLDFYFQFGSRVFILESWFLFWRKVFLSWYFSELHLKLYLFSGERYSSLILGILTASKKGGCLTALGRGWVVLTA